MATSGYTEKYFGSGNNYRVKIEWTCVKDEANNRTTINAQSSLWSSGSSYTMSTGQSKSGTIIIDGNTHSITKSAFNHNGGWTTLGTASRVLTHNSDGSRSFSFGGAFTFNLTLYYSNGSTEYVGTVTTPTTTMYLDKYNRMTVHVNIGSQNWAPSKGIWVNTGSQNWTQAKGVWVCSGGSTWKSI